MRKLIAAILLLVPLAGCATPKSIKDLARTTGPLIAQTHGAAARVQQQFVRQNSIVENRIARWDERAQTARAISAPQEALWTVDGATGISEAKASLLLLEQVRKNDSVSQSARVAPPTASAANPGNMSKILTLLEGIANGKLATLDSSAAWVKATDDALENLQHDAEQADKTDAATNGGQAANGDGQ